MALSRREWLVLSGVGAAAALAGAVVGPILLQSRSGAADLQLVPLPDLTGHTRQISEWRGKIVLVNFWATWCAPCREEIPMLISLHEMYSSSGLEIVGIAVDSVSNVIEYASKYGIMYPVLIADAGGIDVMRKLGNAAGALPYTVVLDRRGVIVSRKLGILRRSEVEHQIKEMLKNDAKLGAP
jgi:thiol-disulfide isomerase/thioredoxin